MELSRSYESPTLKLEQGDKIVVAFEENGPGRRNSKRRIRSWS